MELDVVGAGSRDGNLRDVDSGHFSNLGQDFQNAALVCRVPDCQGNSCLFHGRSVLKIREVNAKLAWLSSYKGLVFEKVLDAFREFRSSNSFGFFV